MEILAEETVVVSQLLEFIKSNSDNGTIMYMNKYIGREIIKQIVRLG